jgi:hypothetical protein
MDRAVLIAPRKARDRPKRPAALEGVDQLDDRLLSFAPHHETSMLERFVCAEGHVRTPEHDVLTQLAQLIGQCIAGRLGGGGGRDADEVGGQALIEVDGRKHLAEDCGVVAQLG